MTVELTVEDVRARILDFDFCAQNRQNPLREFFQFRQHPRNFSNPAALADCYFYDLVITYYVQNWGPHAPPPHPGIFEEFFPRILKKLIGSGNTLTLFIKSFDRDYFNEFAVIETILAPRRLKYVLLPNLAVSIDPRVPLDAGHLIFEWPADSLDYIVQEWFMSPTVSIEGYIGPQLPLSRIAELYFQPDREERIRELLRDIEVGFRVWTDNNGLFVLTDKLNRDALRERVNVSDLDPLLQEAALRYDLRSSS